VAHEATGLDEAVRNSEALWRDDTGHAARGQGTVLTMGRVKILVGAGPAFRDKT
jgi:hypothetical protein